MISIPDFTTPFWTQFILIGKISGALTSIGGLLYFGFKVLQGATTLNKLATNHIPHIQESLNEHGKAIDEIRSDVRNTNTILEAQAVRLEDTKKSIHVLGESFLEHLQTVSVEPPRRKRKKHEV